MSRFKPGDIIVSTADTPLRKAQVFEDYGVALEYNRYHEQYPAVGVRNSHWTVELNWGDYWVLDETSMVERLLEEYNQTTNEDI